MAQIKRFTWTNPAGAVVRNFDVGFTVAEATSIDITNGGSWYWIKGMGDGYYLDVDAGTITAANGFTPLAQDTAIGATISGFTNANPGVITVNDTATFGYAIGDTIKVSDVADDLTGAESLNNTFTIATVTAPDTITLVEDTSVAGYSVWVSGGRVIRVSDVDGVAIPIENKAIGGVTVGTGAVGAGNAAMIMIVKGENSVV